MWHDSPQGRLRLRDDLHQQKAQSRFVSSRPRLGPILGVAQPLEDQVGVHCIAARYMRNGNARRRRLQADRTLLLSRPKPSRPPRHAWTVVSTIDGGHYPALSCRGGAVMLDGYARSAASASATGSGIYSGIVAKLLTKVFARSSRCRPAVLHIFPKCNGWPIWATLTCFGVMRGSESSEPEQASVTRQFLPRFWSGAICPRWGRCPLYTCFSFRQHLNINYGIDYRSTPEGQNRVMSED